MAYFEKGDLKLESSSDVDSVFHIYEKEIDDFGQT